jgi:hypothetical protein
LETVKDIKDQEEGKPLTAAEEDKANTPVV